MDLVDVDVVGAQAAQRIIDLPHDSTSAGVAVDLAIAPFQSRLGGNHRFSAHASKRCADDFLGHAKAVDRRGVDEIDALTKGGMNGRNRFAIVSSSPHPSAHGPCSERHPRDFELGLGNAHELDIDRDPDLR
jgi:hypothetical protein